MTTRRRFTGEFKARVALEALRGDKTVQEIAAKHKVHPNQVSAWKRQASEGLSQVFSNGADRGLQDREAEVHDLHAKIGQLTVERDFLAKGLKAMSRGERKAMIEPRHPGLSLSRQCRLLSIGRSSFYYTPIGASLENLALMRRIDELFLKYPFYGSRQMVFQLRREGIEVGRHRVRRLMRLMGLQAIYQAPRTSTPHPAHRVYPYLLRDMTVERPDQVWCADITYIPVRRGFLYLVTIMDWATRHVLAWRLSNTMDAGFCIEALADALAQYGRPEIFNTDQGSQFTSFEFTGALKDAGVAISMDGRGRCMDNIFIERLWRSLKYEAVYLHELSDGFVAERVIGSWIGFYNTERPHSALDGQTPAAAYSAGRPVDMMDKARALPTSPQAPHQQQAYMNRILAA
ncbi:IS3 family transposase [Hypericibacter sp.]|uniref:IS3 family transposase n=1 Tax=Hypericibacter sp. TaxID=2705401 RepID=UPI003D6D0AF2